MFKNNKSLLVVLLSGIGLIAGMVLTFLLVRRKKENKVTEDLQDFTDEFEPRQRTYTVLSGTSAGEDGSEAKVREAIS